MSKLEFTHEEDLADSGLPRLSRAMPIRQSECELAVKRKAGDQYSLLLLEFTNRRIKRMAKLIASLQQEIGITRNLNEALRQKADDLQKRLECVR